MPTEMLPTRYDVAERTAALERDMERIRVRGLEERVRELEGTLETIASLAHASLAQTRVTHAHQTLHDALFSPDRDCCSLDAVRGVRARLWVL